MSVVDSRDTRVDFRAPVQNNRPRHFVRGEL
jgi:hypothetical protein